MLSQLQKPGLEIMFEWPAGSSSPTPEELRAGWAPTLGHLKQHIDWLAAELRGRLVELPCLQVLSALVVTTAFHDPEQYRESDALGSAIHSEYPTWLYLTADRRPHMTADVLDGEAMQGVFDLLQEIAAATQRYYTIQSQIAAASPATAKEEVLIRARSWHLFVRGPSYEHHNRAQLGALFEPFAPELREILGFDLGDALRVETALTALVNERVNSIRHEMADSIKELHAALRASPDGVDPEYQSLLEWLRRTENPRNAAVVMAATWAQTHWYKAFVVTPADVAEASNLAIEVVARILERFSTPFGQPRRGSDWPSVEDRLERAPLIDLGDGGWWAGLIFKLMWAIAPALEDGLAASKHWERYQSQRSRWLEGQAVALIAGSNPRIQRWTNLHYPKDNELDGLVLCGGTAILIETKAGRMSLPGRRGAPSGTQTDLRALLSDPQRQLNRATEYLLGRDEAVFETMAGTVTVRRAELNRLVHIIVTLESLTAFVTRLPQLGVAGLFDRHSLPWAVDVNDLLVCTDLLGSPARLVHYIDRRMRATRRGVEALEELDFLGHYITRGLYFDELDEEVHQVRLTSHTEPLDDYYRHEAGARETPAPKPVASSHPVISELIANLEAAAPANFAEAVFWLLELGAEGQANLAQLIDGRRARARDGMLTALRSFMGPSVFVYMATPDDDQGPLVNYLTAVKYDGRFQVAVGVAQSIKDPTKLAVEVQNAPWSEDVELAQWSEEFLAMFATRTWSQEPKGLPTRA